MRAWLFACATLIILWAFWHDLQDREADEEPQQEWPIEYDAPQKPGALHVVCVSGCGPSTEFMRVPAIEGSTYAYTNLITGEQTIWRTTR